MRDNRDPALVGQRLLDARAREDERVRGIEPLSKVADYVSLDVKDYTTAIEPNVPMCGLPPEGRRALTNGKPGTKIDPVGMRPTES
jgi:hypothetical protein